VRSRDLCQVSGGLCLSECVCVCSIGPSNTRQECDVILMSLFPPCGCDYGCCAHRRTGEHRPLGAPHRLQTPATGTVWKGHSSVLMAHAHTDPVCFCVCCTDISWDGAKATRLAASTSAASTSSSSSRAGSPPRLPRPRAASLSLPAWTCLCSRLRLSQTTRTVRTWTRARTSPAPPAPLTTALALAVPCADLLPRWTHSAWATTLLLLCGEEEGGAVARTRWH
jgi:hypothetical protein